MSLQRTAIDNATVTWFTAFLILVGGIAAFFSLGQLEDPEFSIKTAIVSTTYPGATPEEVELEVTDALELELQTIEEVDSLESFSRVGHSRIKVNIKASYPSDALPQIWDKVRARVERARSSLPTGAGEPVVIDDFGDVFGLLLALTGDGYSPSEMESFADDVKREISLVDGVARVDLWGVQARRIYLDVKQSRLEELGISDATIAATLENQNAVVDGGRMFVGTRTMRVRPTGEFRRAEDIGNLVLRPSLTDAVQSSGDTPQGRTDEILRLRDVGDVREGYEDPPSQLMRFNGQPAIGLAIAPRSGENVVEVGKRIDRRLAELSADLPVGIGLQKVHWQSDVIDQSVQSFMISLLQAVAIVLVVLTLPMGWRMGFVIGTALILTVVATFMLMAIVGVDLQRMSLGALVIALGMMVDNAIVVADGYAVRVGQGMKPRDAAMEASTKPAMPLLGATVIAVLAFYPIFSSEESAGEYCATLFSVVAISLMVSWVISVTVTPLQCMGMIKPSKNAGGDQYGGALYQSFRKILGAAIRVRFLTLAGAVALLVAALGTSGGVTKLFFPDSAMTKFMVDYWMPEGTRIERVAADMAEIEARLMQDERVSEVAAFIGAGPPRFYLPVEPESSNPAYGQLIVNVRDQREINALLADLRPWVDEHFPDALVPLRKYTVGPGDTWKLELRVSGPGNADPATLREIGDEVLAIVAKSPYAGLMQTDWRQQMLEVSPDFNHSRASWAGITREDVARTTRRTYDGLPVGVFRDDDDLVPIVMRNVEAERGRPGNIDVLGVRAAIGTASVPIAQVVDGVALRPRNAVIARYDRRRTLTVQATPAFGTTFPTLYADVIDEIEALELPPGYTFEWGGEQENSTKNQASLLPGMVPAGVIMLFVMVALFNAIRPPLVILLTIPFALIGVIFGLYWTGVPLGFVALLAAMSLAGMMIKNALVLLDEINAGLERGLDHYDATIEAAVSRLRPVFFAAATTVLGVIPLLQDVFWVGLAVTIMAGLSFGTFLTMILVPTLYAMLYRLKPSVAAG
jgi:multidrug efflux pump subunit AcrB